MHQQFNIQQLYVLPTLYLCVLYLSENKQRHRVSSMSLSWEIPLLCNSKIHRRNILTSVFSFINLLVAARMLLHTTAIKSSEWKSDPWLRQSINLPVWRKAGLYFRCKHTIIINHKGETVSSVTSSARLGSRDQLYSTLTTESYIRNYGCLLYTWLIY